MSSKTLTVTIEGEAAERLAELSTLSGRSEAWFANVMIAEYAREELEIVRQSKDGLDSLAGGHVPHETVMAEMDERLKRMAAKTGKRSGCAAAE